MRDQNSGSGFVHNWLRPSTWPPTARVLIAEHETREHVDRVLSEPPRLVDLRGAIAEVTHVLAPRPPEQFAS